MKKAFRNWVCICCVFALLLISIPGLSAIAAASNTFHLRIEGSTQTILNENVDLTTGETLDTALKAELDAHNISYKVTTGAYGDYIESIGSDVQSADGSTYWSLYQNGSYASLGISSLQPVNGDDIVIAYSASDTLYPKVSVSPSAPSAEQPFTFTVTADKTTYDSNWNPTTTTVPVSGATVAFNGVTQTTDASGSTTFTAPAAAGTYHYSISQERSGQAPLLVRLSDVPLVVSASSSSSSTSSSSASGSSSTSGNTSSDNSSSGSTTTVSDAAVAKAAQSAASILSNDTSDWTAFALARAGYAVPSAYLPALATDLAENSDSMNAISLAKYVLILRAAGEDPTNFNGINLIDKLYRQTNVGQTGLNGYIFTLLALDSADYTAPANAAVSKANLVSTILSSQNTDGSFALAASLPGDVDITAMTLASLAPHVKETGVQEAVTKGLAYLASRQQNDGGFISSGSTSESSESTAQVIIALSALGINAASNAQFAQSGCSPLSNLLAYATQDGGFAHVSGGATDTIATQQALEALTAYQRFEKGADSLYNLRDAQAIAPSSSSTDSSSASSQTSSTSSSASVSSASSSTSTTSGAAVPNPDTGAKPAAGAISAIVLTAGAALLLTRRRKQ